MRQKRVIIYDDDDLVLGALRAFFNIKDYETITMNKPIVCPLSNKDEEFVCSFPCSDIILSDFNMPDMNGMTLFQKQSEKGCKTNIRNKAIMSGYMDPQYIRILNELGIKFFQKPLDFSRLSVWMNECEQRINLQLPLMSRRRESRTFFQREIEYMLDIDDRHLKGDIQNFSESGVCIKMQTPLIKYQVLRISGELPIDCRKAVVCWTRKTDDNYYLAGLHCG